MRKAVFLILIFLMFLNLSSCKKDTKNQKSTNNSTYNNQAYQSHNTHGSDNYHTDSNYKYEFRTGTSGNYEYNYDVNGSDYDGNSVSGNVDVKGKYGSGTIEDEDGNTKDVDVEWIDYGTLEATDEDGNTYELEVDE